jgi:hypothetical protein
MSVEGGSVPYCLNELDRIGESQFPGLWEDDGSLKRVSEKEQAQERRTEQARQSVQNISLGVNRMAIRLDMVVEVWTSG